MLDIKRHRASWSAWQHRGIWRHKHGIISLGVNGSSSKNIIKQTWRIVSKRSWRSGCPGYTRTILYAAKQSSILSISWHRRAAASSRSNVARRQITSRASASSYGVSISVE